MMPIGNDRAEYLAHLRQLAEECQAEPPATEQPDPTEQLAFLAEALERIAMEVSEIRSAQDTTAAVTLSLERRVTALEQSAPSPQSWRDLIQGIRGIREVVAAQAASARQLR